MLAAQSLGAVPVPLQHVAVTGFGARWHRLRFGPGYAAQVRGFAERDRLDEEQGRRCAAGRRVAQGPQGVVRLAVPGLHPRPGGREQGGEGRRGVRAAADEHPDGRPPRGCAPEQRADDAEHGEREPEQPAERTDRAERLGSANTLVRTATGWRADNTDVGGLMDALGPAWQSGWQDAVVLGAGATARSALLALEGLGATRVTVHARRPEQVADLLDWAAAAELQVSVRPGVLAEWATSGQPVVVSTLPPGAGAEEALTITLSALPPLSII